MKLRFINREQELAVLDGLVERRGFGVVFGRRRVGKTRLLREWIARVGGLYSQAIEGSSTLQIEQVFADIAAGLDTTILPKSWAELFELVSLSSARVLCIDELPYLVASDPGLPSVIQRWLDRDKRGSPALIVAGSSTRMMNDALLHRGAPLFGRAMKVLQVEPMGYRSFCTALKLPPRQRDSFVVHALVGGVPRYWELVEARDPVAVADALFFGYAPILEHEPSRLLRDEGFGGTKAQSLLEAIGRGAHKPSEIAARLGTAQTNLSRLLQELLDASLIERVLPFGESVRTTKRTLYRIADPTLRFWFSVYSPHRTRWQTYGAAAKEKLLRDHASTVFEDVCRRRFEGAARYWEKGVELDLVRAGGGRGDLVVTEVKFATIGARDRKMIEADLASRWGRTALAARHPKAKLEVLGLEVLGSLP